MSALHFALRGNERLCSGFNSCYLVASVQTAPHKKETHTTFGRNWTYRMALLIAALLARLILFPVFIVAGLSKLANLDSTREMLTGFGLIGRTLTVVAVALPLVELAVAAALIIPPVAYAGAMAAAGLLGLFTAVIFFALAHGRHPACSCFGQIDSKPISALTLVRSGLLTALGLVAVVAGPAAAATWRLDQLFGVAPGIALAGAGAVVGLLLLLLIAAAQLKILHRLAKAQAGAAPAATAYASPTTSYGLPIGSLAPSFALSDTRGNFVTLEQLLAPRRPVILLFIKSDCPPCSAMAGEVDRWQKNHSGVLNLVRVDEGVAAMEEYALLQARGEVAQAYNCWGTPCAVLVTSEGQIGSRAAQGAAAIRALVKRTVTGVIAEAVQTA